MIKIFKLTEETKINKFLKKYPEHTINIVDSSIVINYSDSEKECVPYRTIKFRPRVVKIEFNGDYVLDYFTHIRYFEDCFMLGDNIRIFPYQVGGCSDGYRAYFYYRDNKESIEIKNILLWERGVGELINWNSGYWEHGHLNTYFHHMVDYLIEDFIECDEDYKFDTRTKGIISVGKNIKKGLEYAGDKISNSIDNGSTQIASSIASIAHSNSDIAEATAYGKVPRRAY